MAEPNDAEFVEIRKILIGDDGSIVESDNCKEQIEQRMADLVDLLAEFPDAKIDTRAWSQLLIYAPTVRPEVPSHPFKADAPFDPAAQAIMGDRNA